MREGFRPKSLEDLQIQQKSVSKLIDESIAPPSDLEDESIFVMSTQELKDKWPARYEMYLKMLRASRGVNEIPEGEKKHMTTWLRTLNSLDTYIDAHNREGGTLREKQLTVFDKMRDFLEQSNYYDKKGKYKAPKGYVKLPTGVGKTILFLELLKATKLKSLIVAPRNLLIEQTKERSKQFGDELDIGVINGYKKQYGYDVIATTYESLVSQLKSGGIDHDEYDALILDEAHRSLSPARKEAISKFSQETIMFAFTATPNFSEEKKLEDILPEKIEKIYEMQVREAIEEGLLADCRCVVVKTDVDISDVKVTRGKYDEQLLQQCINTESRNMAAVQVYNELFKDKLAVAYCLGITHAEELAKKFIKEGVSAAAISGDTPKALQTQMLMDFHEGKIKVLCNADLLIEGFDEPRASVCLNLQPVLSAVNAEQRGGRVLRLDPDDPEKVSYVVDFIDKGNKKNQPILYSDVLGGAAVGNIQRQTEKIEATEKINEKLEIEIEGMKVFVNPEEVMEVISQSRLIPEKAPKTKERKEKLEPQPGEWLTDIQIRAEINKNLYAHYLFNEAFRTSELHVGSHPEWKKSINPPTGSDQKTQKVYFAAEMLDQVKKDVQEIPQWVSGEEIFKKIAERIGAEYGKNIFSSYEVKEAYELLFPVQITEPQWHVYEKVYYSPGEVYQQGRYVEPYKNRDESVSIYFSPRIAPGYLAEFEHKLLAYIRPIAIERQPQYIEQQKKYEEEEELRKKESEIIKEKELKSRGWRRWIDLVDELEKDTPKNHEKLADEALKRLRELMPDMTKNETWLSYYGFSYVSPLWNSYFQKEVGAIRKEWAEIGKTKKLNLANKKISEADKFQSLKEQGWMERMALVNKLRKVADVPQELNPILQNPDSLITEAYANFMTLFPKRENLYSPEIVDAFRRDIETYKKQRQEGWKWIDEVVTDIRNQGFNTDNSQMNRLILKFKDKNDLENKIQPLLNLRITSKADLWSNIFVSPQNQERIHNNFETNKQDQGRFASTQQQGPEQIKSEFDDLQAKGWRLYRDLENKYRAAGLLKSFPDDLRNNIIEPIQSEFPGVYQTQKKFFQGRGMLFSPVLQVRIKDKLEKRRSRFR